MLIHSGVKQQLNDNGDKSDWNSTSFKTADHWMTANEIDANSIDVDEAKARLRDWVQPRCKPEAKLYLQKLKSL
ncbi:hypothetical protein ACFPPD_02165 [Cohnella suwonensis]|uniref:Uncharacterized protein n=1 Tax=Cohnella suwonensis TaxID=696072 RepID=A0ABW0LNM9_9BACL